MQKVQYLRSQGHTPDTNPELAKMISYLTMIQNHCAFNTRTSLCVT